MNIERCENEVKMIQNMLGDEVIVTLHECDKGNNITMYGAIIADKNSKNQLSPVYYFDPSKGCEADAKRIVKLHHKTISETPAIDISCFEDYEKAKERLILRLSSNPPQGVVSKPAFADLYMTALWCDLSIRQKYPQRTYLLIMHTIILKEIGELLLDKAHKADHQRSAFIIALNHHNICICLRSFLKIGENMIKEIQGNLLDQPVQIIAHQTNCVGAMGAGIAKQIKERLLSADVYDQYVKACKQYGSQLLGQTQILSTSDGRLIANCFGENVPTGHGKDTDYDALMHSLAKTRNYAKKNNLSVGIPGLMGCGLAGGDWRIVREIIYKLFEQTPEVELTICYFLESDYCKWNPAK